MNGYRKGKSYLGSGVGCTDLDVMELVFTWSWSYWQLLAFPYGCWELNFGPFQEQRILLTSEVSLQPFNNFLSNDFLCVIGKYCLIFSTFSRYGEQVSLSSVQMNCHTTKYHNWDIHALPTGTLSWLSASRMIDLAVSHGPEAWVVPLHSSQSV